MSTFDLSLAMPNSAPSSDVKASGTYQKKIDETQEKPVEQKVTESGEVIDKSKAPKLVISGPLGNYYTQLLNKTLSIESMGAVGAAEGMVAADAQADFSQNNSGKVVVTDQGASIDSPADGGYIYIARGADLNKDQAYAIADKLMSIRASNPTKQVGLALLGSEHTPVMETLISSLPKSGISITQTPSGVTDMARQMLETK